MTRQLDLVFLVDTTGSMGPYLNAAKMSIDSIINTIRDSEQIDMRFGLVEYKDHKPIEPSFAYKEYGWMTDKDDMVNAVNQMQAYGGGMDGPESVTCAFDCAVNFTYRQYAAKVIVWIADAPPHGFHIQYDGFPDGCPCGIDFQKVVLRAVEKDIQVYAVAAEPIRDIYRHFRDLMRAVAAMTGGQFVPLTSADALGDVIIGGSLEEVSMMEVVRQIQYRLEADAAFKTLPKEEQEKRIRQEIADYCANTTIKKVDVNSVFKGTLPDIPKIFFTATTFKELVDVLKTREPNIYHFKRQMDEYIPTPQAFWDNNGVADYRRKSMGQYGRRTTAKKERDMIICDGDDFTLYRGVNYPTEGAIDVPKEAPVEFKEGEVVRIAEAPVDDVHKEKLAERLIKRMGAL